MPARPQAAPTDDWHQIALLARAPGQRTYELIRPVVLFGQSPAERAVRDRRRRAHPLPAGRSLRSARHGQLRAAAESREAPLTSARGPPGDPRCQTRAPAAERARVDDDLLGALWPPPQLAHRQAHPRREPAATPDPPALPALPRHRRPDPAPPGHRPPPRRGLERHVDRRLPGDEPADGPRDAEALGGGGVRRHARQVAGAAPAGDQGDAASDGHGEGATREPAARRVSGPCGPQAARDLPLAAHLRPHPGPQSHALRPAQAGACSPRPKPMPFKAARRHQYWSADIRYLDHGLGDFKVYSVTILDNYSRAVVASGLSRTQDLGTFLMVLFMAIQQHGAPEGLVTDGGSIFRAKQLLTILDRIGIQKHEIARRQAWQNYVEALFGVQRRMADWGFAHAGSWPELLAVHDLWVADYNYQDHFAHQDRPEDRRSPAAVLHRVCGTLFAPEALHRIFYSTRFGRVLGPVGLRAVPPLARLRRAGPGRRTSRGLAVCRAPDARLPRRAAGALPRSLPARPASPADGNAGAAVRDAASLAAAAALDVGRGRVAAGAAAAGLRAAAAADDTSPCSRPSSRWMAQCARRCEHHNASISVHGSSYQQPRKGRVS